VRGGASRASAVQFRGVAPSAGNATDRGSSPFPVSGAAPALQSVRPDDRTPLAVAPVLLTVRQVAELLSVSTATVYALCERQKLAHVRVANAIRIEPAALAAYLEEVRRA